MARKAIKITVEPGRQRETNVALPNAATIVGAHVKRKKAGDSKVIVVLDILTPAASVRKM